MKSRAKTYRRRTSQEVQNLLGRYHQSGMSVAAFCRQEGVAESVVYRWLRRERSKKPAVKLVEVKSAPAVLGPFRVVLPGGYQIEVPANFDEHGLRRLVGALER